MAYKTAIYLQLVILYFASIATSFAAGWDEARFKNLSANQSYMISSGTGFYISQNYIVTNEHVVRDCRNIAIRGAVEPNTVTLVSYDNVSDLAILYSSIAAPKAGLLRSNTDNMQQDTVLYTMGYPLERGKSGEYIISSTRFIRNSIDEINGQTNIEFYNTIDHGNSGGPLLDINSNIVGVIRARKTYFDPRNPSKIYDTTGVAIGNQSLISFLSRSGVIYGSSKSNDQITNIEPIANKFIVNIHCVK